MNFHLEKQFLSVKTIDFYTNSIEGSTHLSLWPRIKNLKLIKLNCSGPTIEKVVIKDDKNEYIIYDFICDGKFLSINIPEDFQNNLSIIILKIDFKSTGAKCGLQFVVSRVGEKGDHMYCAPYNNATGSAFPCLEWDQACKWQIDIQVPNDNMVAICCDSLENIYGNIYSFFLTHPTTARNISFVVGQFDFMEDPENPRLTYYTPPNSLAFLKCSIGNIRKMFDFMTSNLRFELPFQSYKAVFVDYMIEDYHSSAFMTLFDVVLLHNNRYLEQIMTTNTAMASAVAEQYFGVYVEPKQCTDRWFCWGLSLSLAWSIIRETMYKDNPDQFTYYLKELMGTVLKYEDENGGMILYDDDSPTKLETNNGLINNSDCEQPIEMSVRYKHNYRLKAAFAIRSWMLIVSQIGVMKLMKKYIERSKFVDSSAINDLPMGKWASFINSTVKKKGHISLTAKSYFHKRRKMIEIKFAQPCSKREYLYEGNIKVFIQEPEGLFERVVWVPRSSSGRVEVFPCTRNSRFRLGQKLTTRRRDLIDATCLGWITIDDELMVFGRLEVVLDVADARIMTRKEIDVWTRYIGLRALTNSQCQEDIDRLLSLVTNKREQLFLRQEAISQLTTRLSRHGNYGALSGILPKDCLKSAVVALFCSQDRNLSLKFTDDYIILMDLLVALGQTYVAENIQSLRQTIDTLIELRESLYGLTNVATVNLRAEALTTVVNLIRFETVEMLTADDFDRLWKLVANDLVLEFACPSHRFVMSAACLRAIARFHQLGLIESTIKVQLRYDLDHNRFLRLAGVSALLSYVNNDKFDSNAVACIVEYICKADVPLAVRCDAVNLWIDKLTLLYANNQCVLPYVYDILHGHILLLLTMTSSDNPVALVTCVGDLIGKIELLRLPNSDLAEEVESQLLLNLLETKSLASDDEPDYVTRHNMDHDVCRLTDSDDEL